MNAIVALCHFCEVHGPGAIFCTQTLRDNVLLSENLAEDSFSSNLGHNTDERRNCLACTTLGKSLGFISKDPESSLQFLSTQVPVSDFIIMFLPILLNILFLQFISPNVVFMVKQAAVRSLSCDVLYMLTKI